MKDLLSRHHYVIVLILLSLFFAKQQNMGYGVEEDSLTAVYTAYESHTSGSYVMSRLPGHPAYEYLLRWLWPVRHWAYPLLNVIGLIMSVVFLHLIFKLTDRDKTRQQITGYLFLIPVMFTSLFETMEYALSLSALIIAWWAAETKRPWLSAVFIVFATGFRLPNLIFGLPLFLMIGHRLNLRTALGFAIVSFLGAGLMYYPVWSVYGPAFFDTYSLPYPPTAKVIYKGTVGVWGLAGSAGIGIAFLGIRWAGVRAAVVRMSALPYLIALVFSIGLYIVLPEKSAFLMPFVVLFGSMVIRFSRLSFLRTGFVLIAMNLMILDVDLVDPYRGVPEDEAEWVLETPTQKVGIDFYGFGYEMRQAKARNKYRTTEKIYESIQETDSPALVVTGWWYPFLQVHLLENNLTFPEGVTYVYYATEEQIEDAKSQGKSILFTPEADIYNRQRYGHDLLARYGTQIQIAPNR